MELAFWRDISIVWLAILCLIGQIIPLAALYFLVRGMAAAQRSSSNLLGRAQGYSRAVRDQSESLSHRVSEPVIQLSGQGARWRTISRRLWPGFNQKKK